MKFTKCLAFSCLMIFSSASFGKSLINRVLDDAPKWSLFVGALASGGLGMHFLLRGSINSIQKVGSAAIPQRNAQNNDADIQQSSWLSYLNYNEWNKNAKFNYTCAAGCFAFGAYLGKSI